MSLTAGTRLGVYEVTAQIGEGYSVKGDTFVAEKPRVWIAALAGTEWDLAPDGKRVAVLIPEATAHPRARARDRHAPEFRGRTAAARAAGEID